MMNIKTIDELHARIQERHWLWIHRIRCWWHAQGTESRYLLNQWIGTIANEKCCCCCCCCGDQQKSVCRTGHHSRQPTFQGRDRSKRRIKMTLALNRSAHCVPDRPTCTANLSSFCLYQFVTILSVDIHAWCIRPSIAPHSLMVGQEGGWIGFFLKKNSTEFLT